MLPLLRTLSALILASVPAFADGTRFAGAVAFALEETLMHPTATSVTLSMIPDQDAELLVRYGTGRPLDRATQVTTALAGQRATFTLRELEPGTEYVYRVSARPLGGEIFSPRAPHTFRTLREAGEPVTFGILADSHAYAVWSQHACQDPPEQEGWGKLVQTYANMQSDDALDFVVVGGDDVMTHCSTGCVKCTVAGQNAGKENIKNVEHARLRYRQTFGPELHGRLARDLPLMYMLGNHDGEPGFKATPTKPCGHSNQLKNWSETARREWLPNAGDTYAGGPLGNYYAFESGDALFVVLDVLRYTTSYPANPEGWTLGDAQFAWLEQVLAASDKPWKLVFAEHLVGGMVVPPGCYWYGRGSIRCTTDGLPTSPFEGEQAAVHELLRTYGAQAVFLFHDHVAAIGEKPGQDGVGQGVWYVTTGQASAREPWWSNDPVFSETMDFDLDGVAEYLTNNTGTREKGYFRVTVDDETLRMEYVLSAPGQESNGTSILDWTIGKD